MFSPSESLYFSQSMDRGVYFFPEIDSIRELNEKFSRPIDIPLLIISSSRRLNLKVSNYGENRKK